MDTKAIELGGDVNENALTYYSEPENTKKRTGAWLAVCNRLFLINKFYEAEQIELK